MKMMKKMILRKMDNKQTGEIVKSWKKLWKDKAMVKFNKIKMAYNKRKKMMKRNNKMTNKMSNKMIRKIINNKSQNNN